MLARARIVAVGVAAIVAALASTGCPSLDSLECRGAACTDGSASGDGPAAEAAAGDGGAEAFSPPHAIFCGGGGATCSPPNRECCFGSDGGTSCTSLTGCGGGSDIFCDDPGQCSSGTCWICVNGQGFQGTSCDYTNDIVNQDHCDATNARVLCHDTSQCEGGTTCQPFPVAGLDPGDGGAWFMACQ